MCSHFEVVCFLKNASILIETGCYLNGMNTSHTLLVCDFREAGILEDLSSVTELPDGTYIFYENNSILLFALNDSKKRKNS